jgi:AcrR family transcriptional regulator
LTKATLKSADGKTWQKAKSENTRTLILDAAIECFYDLGYNNTTTEKIAKKANVSRGAMLHHFSSRKTLIKATVEHLAQKRLDLFESQETKIQEKEEHTLISEGIDAYWEQLHSPLFIVFHELQVASRTDSELHSVMMPALKKLEDSWKNASIRVFPDLAQSKAFNTANMLTAYFLEGMAVSSAVRGPVPKKMVTWLKGQLTSMFEDVRDVKRKVIVKSPKKKK